MHLTLSRVQSNHLYTIGKLVINDGLPFCTLEYSPERLPVGNYQLQVVKQSARKQTLCVLRREARRSKPVPTGHIIAVGQSWISSRRERSIVVGTYLIPGAVRCSGQSYDKIVDRITKAFDRGEAVSLSISDRHCRPTHVLRHWLTALALLSVLALSASGCSSLRPSADPVVVQHTHHDTVYLHHQLYDSVSVFHSHEKDSRPDTVFIRDTFTEYRYRLLRDTLRVIKRDTVPVIRQVEVVREVHSLPSWAKTLSSIGAASLLFGLLFITSKLSKL